MSKEAMSEAATRADAYAIAQAAGDADIATARALFLEYGESLDFDLCFQDFDRELATLPGAYAPPRGRLLLATPQGGGATAGVVALRPLDDAVCEMKRLYVVPAHRGRGLGRRLVLEVIAAAQAIGYRAMRLDTVGETMRRAQELYRAHGFVEIPAYYDNPLPGVLYFERDLG